MNYVRGAIVVAAATLIFGSIAFGETVTRTTTVDYGQAFGWLQPYVISIVSAFVAALGTWIVYLVQKYTGIKIDQTQAEVYQRAAMNQAAGMIAKGFIIIRENGKVEVKDAYGLAEAANSVLKSVPEATSHFALKPDDVAKKIIEMVPQIPSTPTPVVTPTPGNQGMIGGQGRDSHSPR